MPVKSRRRLSTARALPASANPTAAPGITHARGRRREGHPSQQKQGAERTVGGRQAPCKRQRGSHEGVFGERSDEGGQRIMSTIA